MTDSLLLHPTRTCVGTVGAYVTSSDVDLVRQIRQLVGRVTVAGKAGLTVLSAMDREGDLGDVDLDPAGYLAHGDDDALIPLDWIGRQRDLGLPVIRSRGTFVKRNDGSALRGAFSESLPPDVARTVSLDGSWLQPKALPDLLAGIRNSEGPLSLVLAAPFDPLDAAGAVDGIREALGAAYPLQRRVELLRTDLAAVPFAAAGGALGSIGLTTTGRHHGLKLGKRAGASHEKRSRCPLVIVPKLLSWQRGFTLGALVPFGGAGVTRCSCDPCDGQDLMRFDKTFTGSVPDALRREAIMHDVHCWRALSASVLGHADPLQLWRAACNDAVSSAAAILSTHKVPISLPRLLSDWT